MCKKLVFNIFTSLDFGGVESHAIMLRKGSLDSDYEHGYVALARGGYIADKLALDGAIVEVLNVNPKIPSLNTIIHLYRLIKKNRPNVVHTRGAEANFHGVIAARLAGVRVIVAEEIGIPVHSKLARVIFKLCYLLSDKVVAISKAVQDFLVGSGEARKDKTHIIYNPTDFFSLRNVSENTFFTIGYIGRLEVVKNPMALVMAVRVLREQGIYIKLEMVGDGAEKKAIDEYVKLHGLEGFVNIHGFMPDPYEAIRNIDLYVQPSITEGFGIAVVEVMGSGIPILASPVGGIPEFIIHGENGFLLDGLDAKSISNSIGKLMKIDNQLLINIGIKGRNSVIDNFTVDNYLENLHSLYDEIIKKKNK